MVSTYPPKKCGLATFTAELFAQLRTHAELPDSCEIGVIAISDTSDQLLYTDPIIHYDLRLDSVSAALNLYQTLLYIKASRCLHGVYSWLHISKAIGYFVHKSNLQGLFFERICKASVPLE